ncbi:Major Facilitator Superfamily protein [Aphelenchoides besseyi]|nr:Major Facilitator Superfamily protein [Aphelenchoides besseyi]KAI6211154.1 Major Facilitator Superfamily protein [Aphelenchoides besseyi]
MLTGTANPRNGHDPNDRRGERMKLDECVTREEGSCSCLPNNFRFVILIIALFCLTSISSNMFTVNIALICMAPAPNVTINSDFPTYQYTQNEKGLLMWAVAVGSLIATFPFSWLYGHFGARFVFFGAGILSAVATALIPLTASMGIWPFTAMRLLQGIAYAADFAVIGVLTSHWASLQQHAIFISVLTCYSPLSLTFTNLFAGFLCNSFLGWPSIYYIHAAAGIVVFVLWLIFYNDWPDMHRRVSCAELEEIHQNKGNAHIEMGANVPVGAIMRNTTILSSWFCAFGYLLSALFLHMYLPIYIHFVLGFNVRDAGIYSSIATFAYIPLKLIFGVLCDNIKSLSETTKVIIFNTIAVAGPAVLYLLLACVQNLPTLSIIVIILIHMLFAASGGGFYKCATLASRQYSHFVIAAIQFIKCLCLFLAPTLFDVFVEYQESKTEWRSIFFIIAAVLALGALIFWRYADTQPATFTKRAPTRPRVSVVPKGSIAGLDTH